MPLPTMLIIDTLGVEITDSFHLADADSALEPGAIVTLARLTQGGAQGGDLPRPLGVVLEPGARLDSLLPHLAALDLICVAFPKFRDGRGFTLARALRERHGFTGAIRAVGPVLPDQAQALVACGVTQIETSDRHPPGQWAAFLAQAPHPAPAQLLNRLLTRAATT